MEQRWLIAALAALTVGGSAQALADEQAPRTETPAGPPVQVAQATPATPESPTATGEMKEDAAEAEETPEWKYGGQADFFHAHNFNRPWNGRNGLRAFDTKASQGPHLGLFELWVEKKRSPIGFRMDFNVGPTANINGSTEQSSASWLKNFQQLYLTANLSKDGRTYVDVGKWVTPIGAEVIEPIGNWMYSQGVAFTWPIPFWHAGGRVYHYLNDTDYVMFNVNTGWGTVKQPSGAGLNYGLTGSKVLSPEVTITGNYMGGDNFAGINSPAWRHLFNAVTAYNPANSRFAFLLDTTLGFQTDFGLRPGQSENAPWFAAALISKYQLRPDQYVAGRFEYLHDDKGALFGNDMDVTTVAVNYTKQWNKYFQTRLEYRHDFAGGAAPFADNRRNTFTTDQGTITIAGIFGF